MGPRTGSGRADYSRKATLIERGLGNLFAAGDILKHYKRPTTLKRAIAGIDAWNASAVACPEAASRLHGFIRPGFP